MSSAAMLPRLDSRLRYMSPRKMSSSASGPRMMASRNRRAVIGSDNDGSDVGHGHVPINAWIRAMTLGKTKARRTTAATANGMSRRRRRARPSDSRMGTHVNRIARTVTVMTAQYANEAQTIWVASGRSKLKVRFAIAMLVMNAMLAPAQAIVAQTPHGRAG